MINVSLNEMKLKRWLKVKSFNLIELKDFVCEESAKYKDTAKVW